MIASDTRPVRCAIYTRKSTEEGLEQEFNSLDAQREAAEAYIASQQHEGWVCLPDRYDDGGFTGGNMDRPAFQRLLADIEAGKVDCVVVYKVDRLSRSLLDFARIMEMFERHQVSFVSVTQQFNTTTSMGRLTLNILLSFAQFEREIISERTRDKIAAARRKGKWTGGRPVLGYDRVKDDAAAGWWSTRTRPTGCGPSSSCTWSTAPCCADPGRDAGRGWTDQAVQTTEGHWRGGLAFDKSSLQKLLTNVTYLGKVRYKGEVYDGEHDAIVDEDLFDRVQGLLRRNRNSGGKHVRNKYGALLKGLVRCKPCGCAMSHHFTTQGQPAVSLLRLHCTPRRTAGSLPVPDRCRPRQLEDFVVDQIRSLGKDPGILQASLRQTQVATAGGDRWVETQAGQGRRTGCVRSGERSASSPRGPASMKGPRSELVRLQDRLREGQGGRQPASTSRSKSPPADAGAG